MERLWEDRRATDVARERAPAGGAISTALHRPRGRAPAPADTIHRVRPIAAAGISATATSRRLAPPISSPIAKPKDRTLPTDSISSLPARIWRLASSIAERVVAATSGSRATASPAAPRTVSAASATASPTAAVRVVSSLVRRRLCGGRSVGRSRAGHLVLLRSSAAAAVSGAAVRRCPWKRQRTTQGGGPGRPCETWRTPRHWRFQGLSFSTLRVRRQRRVDTRSSSTAVSGFRIAIAYRSAGGASAPGPPVAREPTWSSMPGRWVAGRPVRHRRGVAGVWRLSRAHWRAGHARCTTRHERNAHRIGWAFR